MDVDPEAVRTLILVRHAKSSWDGDVPDHERPLSSRGRRDAAAIGEFLQEQSLAPSLVLCSTATRTRQTWAGISGTGVVAAEVRYVPSIYHAWVPELLRLLREVPDALRTVLLLGHAPGVPDLVENVCVPDRSTDWSRLEQKFPTSGVAVVGVPGVWSGLGSRRARLQTFTAPRG